MRWPDFWLPSDRSQAKDILAEAWHRAWNVRVEIACGDGRGRTGTALACLAVIDGIPADRVVSFVRRHYDARAVETLWPLAKSEQTRSRNLNSPGAEREGL